MVKHGVPPMKVPCCPSGSIVFRKIKTVLPWDKVLKKVETAKKLKRKRKKEKERRRVVRVDLLILVKRMIPRRRERRD